MLVIGGLQPDIAAARAALQTAFSSGRAAEIFGSMVAGLGGPTDFVEHSARYLAKAPVVRPVYAGESGPVAAIRTREIGVAVVGLGGGRVKPEDGIDPAVGFSSLAGLGDPVDGDHPLGFVHARDEADADRAAGALAACYQIGAAGAHGPAVLKRVTG